VKVGGVAAADYAYDFRGLRVAADVHGAGAHLTHFVFDPAGHLLAEHDGATGAVVREYVWLDDLLVAVIDASGGTAATYFVHAGPLDEPLQMTDAAKADVWDAYVEPYGQAHVVAASAGLPIRLPGQYEDRLMGRLLPPIGATWMSRPPTCLVIIATCSVALCACGKAEKVSERRPDLNARSSETCLKPADVARLETAPATVEAARKLADYYGICRADIDGRLKWLKVLAAAGDRAAADELSSTERLLTPTHRPSRKP
jgi:hypothetical protein